MARVEPQDTELAVHELLLQSIRSLGATRGEDWPGAIDALCADLLRLDTDVQRTLVAVVRASAVVQEFLFELAVPPDDSRDAVVQKAAWLLSNLDDDEPREPNAVATGSPDGDAA